MRSALSAAIELALLLLALLLPVSVLAAPVALGPAHLVVDGGAPIRTGLPWLAPPIVRQAHADLQFQANGQPQALLLLDMRERVSLAVNGVPLFTNAAGPTDTVLGWNRPYRIIIPPRLPPYMPIRAGSAPGSASSRGIRFRTSSTSAPPNSSRPSLPPQPRYWLAATR